MKIIDRLSKAAVFLLTLPIKFYRKFLSPLLPKSCKYYPTCSAYALEALKKHGVIKGLFLTVWRLLRCNPLSNGGVDYVPDKITLDYLKPKRVRN